MIGAMHVSLIVVFGGGLPEDSARAGMVERFSCTCNVGDNPAQFASRHTCEAPGVRLGPGDNKATIFLTSGLHTAVPGIIHEEICCTCRCRRCRCGCLYRGVVVCG